MKEKMVYLWNYSTAEPIEIDPFENVCPACKANLTLKYNHDTKICNCLACHRVWNFSYDKKEAIEGIKKLKQPTQEKSETESIVNQKLFKEKISKPERMEIQVENIPNELKEKPRWVCWKWIPNKEKKNKSQWTKPPYDPKTGRLADSTNPETWASFETAYSQYLSGRYDGIGFILHGEYTGIDLDDSRNPDTGKIEESCLTEIKTLDSYTEVSPSNRGLKTLAKGNLPKGGHHDEKMGIFETGRYFCITGNVINEVSKQIEDRQNQITAFVRKFWPSDFETSSFLPSGENGIKKESEKEDIDIVEKISSSAQGEKFKKLWSGDWSDYPSQSEADQALCCILAFWTKNNFSQIDTLFRLSGLMRNKWIEHDYKERTISKAIEFNFESKIELPSHEEKPKSEVRPINQNKQSRNLAEELRIWIENAYGNFTNTQIYNDLGISSPAEKTLIRVTLHRLSEKGDIEKGLTSGTFRKIDRSVNIISIDDDIPPALNIEWPGEIEKLVEIMPKSVVVVAGALQAGKTAYLLNVALLNKDTFPTFYFTSEFGSGELRKRLAGFGYSMEIWRKITFAEHSGNFQDVIKPDGLNLVDYLEVDDEGAYYKIPIQIRRIYEKLNTGVAVVGLQKPFGRDFAFGGQQTGDKPRLYISLEKNTLKIVKGKLWKTGTNPNEMTRGFKLICGAKFQWEEWVKPPL